MLEKIRINAIKPFKGHYFLQNQYLEEMQNYLKNKLEKKNKSSLLKIIMPYIKIEPTKKNSIIDNDSFLLLRIRDLIREKEMKKSLESIKLIDKYENFFTTTINQTKIYMEFKQSLLELI